ncbi:hypothetical protein [Halorubrum sp. BV1]|uniref:DUF7857 domain-containing protein n=1 Tax=Halorubrum sp. BV1 TaxID=1498500 RepID=UPI000679C8AF|nr:hypothetical protein [Halorubrum sp. BV1]
MDLAWTVEQDGGVSLVRCRVHNDEAVPRRVRLDSRLDGPVLPPRRAGVPEAGWDASGVSVRLDPASSRAVGFAVPADPVEPPVEISEDGSDREDTRVSCERDPLAAVRSETPALDAIRTLGDHRPPRDAITDGTTGQDADTDGETDGAGGEADRGGDAGGDPLIDGQVGGGDATVPAAVDEWLDTVTARVDRAERLTDADLGAATEVVEETDGLDGVSDLRRRVETDAERLRAVSDRTAALAARAESADVPIEALERLA